ELDAVFAGFDVVIGDGNKCASRNVAGKLDTVAICFNGVLVTAAADQDICRTADVIREANAVFVRVDPVVGDVDVRVAGNRAAELDTIANHFLGTQTVIVADAVTVDLDVGVRTDVLVEMDTIQVVGVAETIVQYDDLVGRIAAQR